MKKICCLLALAACVLMLSACESRSTLPSSSSQEESQSSEAPPSSSDPVFVPPSSEPVPTYDFTTLAGKYVSQDLEIEAKFRPELTLREDGTFSFYINLLSAMGTATGTYEINGVEMVLSIQSVDFEGFSGDDATQFLFDIVSDHSLMFRGVDADAEQSIGSTQPYDLFEKTLY